MKAPFPYFGGKSLIANTVWQAFGTTNNYVEPFAGSLAVLLARPSPIGGSETINDWSCFVVNAWRAIANDPHALASLCIAPAAEVDTEAQHFALVNNGELLRNRLGDPEYYDLYRAAWWIKGCNEWIGSGYCDGTGPWRWNREQGWYKRNNGQGVNRKLPHLGGGKGVNRQVDAVDDVGEYQKRIDWATDWLCALRDRLCSVRMACGDWSRVLGPSPTYKLGTTAIFLDPPYDGTEYVYHKDGQPIAASVGQWCLEAGDNPKLRIILCGRGVEHDHLLAAGWAKQVWKASKGYANHKERETEALWISPHCVKQSTDLFQ